MIEYLFNTGENYSLIDFYRRGSISSSIGNLPTNEVVSTDVSVNGRTYLETIPIITTIAQTQIVNNSGEFYVSGFRMKEGTGYLDLSFGGDLFVDKVRSGERKFYSSDTWASMVTGFSGIVGSNLTGDYVYLNGIRLTSGESYIEDSFGRFVWTDSETGVTGLLFSMPKRNARLNTGVYDLSGDGFNRDATVGFLNGVKLNAETDYLETASIVKMIETGIAPNPTGQNFSGVQISL